MRIGALAARAGTTMQTLRYYESRGLLPARRIVFRGGEPVKTMVGSRPKRRLREELSDVL